MAIDKDLLYHYLGILEEALLRIRKMDFDLNKIIGDIDTQDLLDRRMQKAIEATIDIAAQLVAGLKLSKASSAGDLFRRLAQRKVISSTLANNLSRAVSFRNILVHEYSKVDYQLAYQDLDKKLKDLETFAYQVKKIID